MRLHFDRQLFNVVHLGVAFLVLFSADFTVTNMQKTINASITRDKPEYNVDGYISLGLIYLVYGLFLLLAPSLVAVLRAKYCMVFGAVCITILVFSLMLEIDYMTYIGIFFGGIGGSYAWVAEGNYLVLNSDPETVSRNVGLFWCIYSSSLIVGNLFAVYQLEGKTVIDYDTRQTLLQIMGALGILSCLMFATLGPPKRYSSEQPKLQENPLAALSKVWQIFRSKPFLILLVTFCYGGFQQSFGAGVYPACIGFTRKFGDRAKQLVPLAGVTYGAGDSLGGFLCMLLPRTGLHHFRRHVITLGFGFQAIAYCAAYVNIPDDAVFSDTETSAIFECKIWLALLSSFLIGIGDSCLNTQIFPLIADLQPDYSAHVCALYKFSKSMAMAAYFFCSISLGLHLQLIILLVTGVAGSVAFYCVDAKICSRDKQTTNNDIT